MLSGSVQNKRMSDMSDLRGPPKFDMEGGASEISLRWKQWREEFEAFADCKGLFNMKPAATADDTWVTQRAQRRALLLYCGGQRLREVFSSLDDTGETHNYDAAITALNTHLNVATNSTFQRHMFRKTAQEQGETVGQFVAKLRKASVGCDYASVDSEIRDQVVSGCYSDKLRLKLLEKGSGLTLAKTLGMASTLEAVEQQMKDMKVDSGSINRASFSTGGDGERWSKPNGAYSGASGSSNMSGQNSSNAATGKHCGRCGTSHRLRECPAFGKQCFKCKGKNHFKSMCRSKRANAVSTESGDDNPSTSTTLPDDPSLDSRKSFAFCSTSCKVGLQRTTLLVGNVETRFVVDTGADCNILGKSVWERLKSENVVVTKHVKGGPNIYPYTSDTPMKVVGQFWANVKSVNTQKTVPNTRFIVIAENAEPLLGIQTATELGVVQFVNSVGKDYSSRFPNLFSGGVGKADKEIELTIRDDIRPIAQPYRRVAFPMMDKLEKHLNELVELDIIERVEGPTSWVSPVVIVPKSNDKIRLCVDMRQANTAVVRHHFPVPTVDEMLRDMNGAQYFSKIDLKMGFHQFVLSPRSRDITTFNTHVGLFRYKRLMFGINAAPEIYQREVASIIRGIPGVANLADDIVIHGRSESEHDERLLETLSRLEAAGMTLNGEKCVFSAQTINFLGHQISDKGVDPGVNKVQAISEAAVPKNVMELKSFLGLVGYCSKFIPFFSDKTEPLRKLTVGVSSSTAITLNKEELEAFNKLKRDLCNTETLAYFDIKKETLIYTDASPVGLGAILIQYHDGSPRVVCYASRALTDVETRYMQTEKEALAIVWACERLHHYIFGVHFTLLTDHQALEVIYGSKVKRTSLRIERWVLRLQCYDFTVKYVKGADNIADSLSRLIKVAQSGVELEQPSDTVENTELYVRHTILGAVSAVTAKEVERASFDDTEMSYIRNALENNRFDALPADVPRVFRAIRDELCIIGKLLLRGNRIVVPVGLRERMLELGHEGHLGIVGTKQNLRARVWWPGIDLDVERYVKKCHGCQLTGSATPRDPVRVTDLPNAPWEDLACDLLGPLPNGDNLFVVVDYYSRWYEVRFLGSTTSAKIIEALTDIFETHGIPVSLKSDNGSQFISGEFKQFVKSMGISQHLVTPRWPEANGEVERQNRSLMKRIKIAYAEGLDYKAEVRKYIVAYRNTPHTITGKCPSEMLFGRKVRTRVPYLADIHNDDHEWRDRDSELKHRMVENRNRGKEPHLTQVGDLVLVKRDNPSKVQTPFHVDPFVVREVHGPMLVLESSGGRIYKRNVHMTRPYFCSPVDVVGRPEVTMHVPNTDAVVYRDWPGDHQPEVATEVTEDNSAMARLPRISTPRPSRSTTSRLDDNCGSNDICATPGDSAISAEPRRSMRDSRPPKYLEEYVRPGRPAT